MITEYSTMNQSQASVNVFKRDSQFAQAEERRNMRDIVTEELKMKYRDLKMEKSPWIPKVPVKVADLYCDLEMVISDERKERKSFLQNILDDVEWGKPYRILIEGRAGVGKTILARKLAVDWARKEDYIVEKFKLVFLFELKHFDYNDINHAFQDIGKQTYVDNNIMLQIIAENTEGVLVILDGYDEMPNEKRERLLPLINSESYPKMTVIVTCRTNEFSSSCDQDCITDSETQILSERNEFWRRKILITGLNRKNRLSLLQRILSKDEYDKNIEKIRDMFDGLQEFWACPLFLFMLAKLIKEPLVKIKSKTQLYEYFFNLMVADSLELEPGSVDLLQSLKNCTQTNSNKDSEIDKVVKLLTKFGALARMRGNASFSEKEIGNLENDYKPGFLLRLGILAKTPNRYEGIHHSLVEFLIAVNIFVSFSLLNQTLEEPLLDIIGFVRTHYSLVLPFLAGLLRNESYKLFELLKPFAYEYCACTSNLVLLLLECDMSQQLMTSLTPFLPALWLMPSGTNDCGFTSTDIHKEVVKHGINTGKIKVLSWKMNCKVMLCDKTEVDQLNILVSGKISRTDIISPVTKCKDLKINFSDTPKENGMSQKKWDKFIDCISEIQASTMSLSVLDSAEKWLPRLHKEIVGGKLAHSTFFWLKCCLREKKEPLMPLLTEILQTERIKGLELVFDKTRSDLSKSQSNITKPQNGSRRNEEGNNVLPRHIESLMKIVSHSSSIKNLHLRDRERNMIQYNVGNIEQKWIDVNLGGLHGKKCKWLRFHSVSLDDNLSEVHIEAQHLDLVDVQCDAALIQGLCLNRLKCLSIDSAFLCESLLKIDRCKLEELEVLDIVLHECDLERVFVNLENFQTISVLALTMPFTTIVSPFRVELFIQCLWTLSSLKALQLFGVNRDVKLVCEIVAELTTTAKVKRILPISLLCLQLNSYGECSSNATASSTSEHVKTFKKLLMYCNMLLTDFSLKCLQMICSPTFLPYILADPNRELSLKTIFPYEKGFQITHDISGMQRDDPLNYKHDFHMFTGCHRFSIELVDSRE